MRDDHEGASPKEEYTAPVLEVQGSFETITLGGRTGNFTDAVFPTGTPFADVTFS